MKIKRLYIVILTFIIEIALLFLLIFKLSTAVGYIYLVSEILSVIMVLYLILSSKNPSFKLSWVVIILVFPLFGIFIYFIFGTHHIFSDKQRRVNKADGLEVFFDGQNESVLKVMGESNKKAVKNANFIINTSNCPIFEGTETKLLLPCDKLFEDLLTELEKAEKFILLEFFIIKSGYMYNKIFDILKNKALSGIKVMIIYDDLGCIDRLSKNFKEECRINKIEQVAFNPLKPVLNNLMFYRDHRKIVVIDGNVGFTGGFNIGDEYINLIKPYGFWYDGGIKIKGEAVFSLTAIFFDMWNSITGETIDLNKYRPNVIYSNDGFVQPFCDNPLSYNVSEGVYLNLINTAEDYVYITTPYLVLDREMTVSLCNAAKSGVDVRIITPHIPDKPYVFYVTHSNYEQLLANGVKIFEYSKGFIHAKMILSDDNEGLIGSINVDYRSFNQQYEDAVMLYNSSALLIMKQEFQKLFQESQKVVEEVFKKRKIKDKLLEIIFKLFAPLM